MTADQATRFVAPADLTNAEIAEARRALEDLAKILGRASAEAWSNLNTLGTGRKGLRTLSACLLQR